jgi:hypothetical protein
MSTHGTARKEFDPPDEPRVAPDCCGVCGIRTQLLIKHPNRLARRPVYLFPRQQTAALSPRLGPSHSRGSGRVGGKPCGYAARSPIQPGQSVATDDQMLLRGAKQVDSIRGRIHRTRPQQLTRQTVEGKNPVTIRRGHENLIIRPQARIGIAIVISMHLVPVAAIRSRHTTRVGSQPTPNAIPGTQRCNGTLIGVVVQRVTSQGQQVL